MEEEEDYPFIIRLIIFAFQLVVVVLFIVFTLLTLGIFLPDEKENPKEQKQRRIPSIEEKLRINLARKKNQLIQVRQRIAELQLIVNKIRRTERRILFGVRLVITSLLVLVNWLYLTHRPGEAFSWSSVRQCPSGFVELVTNFNALVLLLYSIPAYLLYGTVGRFTSAMKAKTVGVFRRKHIPTLSELQLMREEEQRLIRDIGYLKTSLELFE